MTTNTTPLVSILITLAGPPLAQAQPWCQPPWGYQQPQQQPLSPGSPLSLPQQRARPKVHQERHWQDMSPEQAKAYRRKANVYGSRAWSFRNISLFIFQTRHRTRLPDAKNVWFAVVKPIIAKRENKALSSSDAQEAAAL
jgi:hypothetical protein